MPKEYYSNTNFNKALNSKIFTNSTETINNGIMYYFVFEIKFKIE